jgi:hypothetical protein
MSKNGNRPGEGAAHSVGKPSSDASEFTRQPAPAQDRRPQRFGPDVPALARLLVEAGALADIALLAEINRRWPNLPFRDFFGGTVLAAALVMPTEGTA